MDRYLYSDSLKRVKRDTVNPFLKTTIKVWYESQDMFGEQPGISQFTPIWGNALFKPGKSEPGFRRWAQLGLQRISDLYKDNILMSFETLKRKFGIPQTHLFKYFQIRSFIHSRMQSYQCPPLSIIGEMAISDPYSKGKISMIYKKLVSTSTEFSNYKRLAWIEDLQTDITEQEWEKARSQAQTISINSRFKLIQYNWLMRT